MSQKGGDGPNLYEGPIEVGMKFLWSPGTEHETTIEVSKVIIKHGDENRIYSKNLQSKEEVWNEEGNFRESVVKSD